MASYLTEKENSGFFALGGVGPLPGLSLSADEPCPAARSSKQAPPAGPKAQGFALFRDDGHLTDEGVQAIIKGTLDELQSLEAAEHLSFCDDCLLRYTALLEDDTLLTPQTPIAPPVLSRIRKKAVRVLFNKYTTVAAAAAFALVVWGTGVFDVIAAPPSYQPAARPTQDPKPATTMVSRMNSFFRGAGETLSQSIDNAFKALRMKQAEPNK